MTKWDKYLIVFIIILAAEGLFLIKSISTNSGNVYLTIEVEGKEYKKISLSPSTTKQAIEIETELGYNLIEYDSSGAKITEASCRDQLCTHMGKITQANQINICLPNKVSIKLTSNNDSDLDIISY